MTDFNPAIGDPPAMEWVALDELYVDESYQRKIEARSSQELIRNIAKDWDWRLCQPLSVGRRPDDTLAVMDGQHRLTAAKMRSDIPRLPCVIFDQPSVEDEAKTFVKLNKRRRSLNSVDVFRASIAAGSAESSEVMALIQKSGLVLAPHSNYTAWQPRMIYCVPGIASAYRRYGPLTIDQGLSALADAFDGNILRYAGQILRSLFVFLATDGRDPDFKLEAFVDRLSMNTQQQWVRKMNEWIARTGQGSNIALTNVFRDAYRKHVE